jgi:MFS family permease
LRQPEPASVSVHTAGLEDLGESESGSADQGPSRLEPDSDLDDWALDVELHRLHRLVTAAMPASQPQSPMMLPSYPWQAGQGAIGAPTNPAQPSLAASRVSPRRRASVVAWSLLGFGIMAFVCGAILLAWSLIADRSELWTLGMPICLAGQLGLLLGLVFQLSRMWDDNRQTANQLASVDQRLDDLKQTATLLTTGHSSPAQSFYAHMAGGAGPQILLADLKSQLDLLAVQMSTTRR